MKNLAVDMASVGLEKVDGFLRLLSSLPRSLMAAVTSDSVVVACLSLWCACISLSLAPVSSSLCSCVLESVQLLSFLFSLLSLLSSFSLHDFQALLNLFCSLYSLAPLPYW